MAKSKQQKTSDLEELTQKVKAAKSIVFADYRGSTVKDMSVFRRTAEKASVFTKVYKLTLVKKALESSGITGLPDFKTPVIFVGSDEDETAAARLVKNIGKDIKTVNILAGVLDGHLVAKAEVTALADLPGKDELRGSLVRTINAPVSGFVNVLAGNIRSLINVLNAVAQKS